MLKLYDIMCDIINSKFVIEIKYWYDFWYKEKYYNVAHTIKNIHLNFGFHIISI